MTENEEFFDFFCKSVFPFEIYKKAREKCVEEETSLYEALKMFMYDLGEGKITIYNPKKEKRK